MLPNPQINISKLYPAPDETLVEYWTSWSPLAPLFGVDWRIAKVLNLPDLPDAIELPTNPLDAAGLDVVDLVPAREGDAVSKVIEAASVEEVAIPAPQPKSKTAVAPQTQDAKPKPSKDAGAAKAVPAPKTTKKQKADDLTQLKGVGPKIAKLLASEGVTTFEDIAKWSAKDVDAWDARPEIISGRIQRDDWVGQAKTLAKG